MATTPASAPAQSLRESIGALVAEKRAVTEEEAARLRDTLFTRALQDPAETDALVPAISALLRAPGVSAVAASMLARSLAEISVFAGRLARADGYYARAVHLAESGNRPEVAARAAVGHVHVLGLLGQPAAARRLAARARRTLRRYRDQEYLAKLSMNAGNLDYHAGRFASAARLYRGAAQVLEAQGEAATALQARVNEAIALTQVGSLRAATRAFAEAEAAATSRGLDYVLAHVRFNRADLDRIRGDYRSAFRGLEEAGKVFEEVGASDLLASTLRTRAELYLELGMPAEAAALGAESASLFAREAMVQDAGLSRLVAVRSLRADGAIQAARDQLAKGAEDFARVGVLQAEVVLECILLDLASGDVGSAAARVRELPRHRFGVADGFAARSALARARVALAAGRPVVAERRLAASLRDVRRTPLRARIELLHLAGAVAAHRGHVQRARAFWVRATRALEDHRVLLPNAALRGTSFAANLEVYLDLMRLELARPRSDPERLLVWSEAARARVLKDRAKTGGTDAGVETADRARLARLLGAREEVEDHAAANGGRRAAEIARLERRLAERARARLERGVGRTTGFDLASSRSALSVDEACISYFCLPPEVLAFVVTREGLSLVRLPTPIEVIESQIDRFRFHLENAAADAGELAIGGLPHRALVDNLERLHAALLAPLEPILHRCARLVLAPHRRLHQVPFECFLAVAPETARRAISRIPSAEFLVARGRVLSRPQGFAALAVHAEGLPAVQREASLAAAEMRRRGVRPVIHQADVTREQLLTALGCRQGVHLATHGCFRVDNPTFSYLRCADGALFVDDLDTAVIRAPLVFLSACESGQVRDSKGDELESVAHALLRAGTRRLVASRWVLDDDATLGLVGRYYRALGSAGKDAARVMHVAMGASHHAGVHPFHWGGFSVYEA